MEPESSAQWNQSAFSVSLLASTSVARRIRQLILTEALDRSEFRACLLCGSVSPGEGDTTPEALAKGLPIKRIPVMRNTGGVIDAVKTIWALYKAFRTCRPQIVHLHRLKARALGALAERAQGCRTLCKHTTGTLFQRYYSPVLAAALIMGSGVSDGGSSITASPSARRCAVNWWTGGS